MISGNHVPQTSHLLQDLRHRTTARISADDRYFTETAGVITAVLDLHIGAVFPSDREMESGIKPLNSISFAAAFFPRNIPDFRQEATSRHLEK